LVICVKNMDIWEKRKRPKQPNET